MHVRAACNSVTTPLSRSVSQVMSDLTKVKVNYFCLGAIFIFVGSVLLCALGFTIVLPFEVTRSWPQVICYVVNSSYDPNVCSCDDQLNVFDTCVSKYPCLQIHVSYAPMNRSVLQGAPGLSIVGSGERKQTLILSMPKDDEADNGSVPKHREGQQSRETSPLRPRSGVLVSKLHLGSYLTTSSVSPLKKYEGQENDDTMHALSSSTPVHLTLPPSYPDSISRTFDSLKEDNGSEKIDFDVLSTELINQNGDLDSNNRPSSALRLKSNVSGDPLAADQLDDIEIDERTSDAESLVDLRSAKLYRSWDDSFHVQCSMTECGDETWNVKESRAFKKNWGDVGQQFPCYYNPDKPEMVIIEKTAPSAAIHAVVWPALCLLAGILLWMGLCMGCWSLKAESVYRDDSGPLYS